MIDFNKVLTSASLENGIVRKPVYLSMKALIDGQVTCNTTIPAAFSFKQHVMPILEATHTLSNNL